LSIWLLLAVVAVEQIKVAAVAQVVT